MFYIKGEGAFRHMGKIKLNRHRKKIKHLLSGTKYSVYMSKKHLRRYGLKRKHFDVKASNVHMYLNLLWI